MMINFDDASLLILVIVGIVVVSCGGDVLAAIFSWFVKGKEG